VVTEQPVGALLRELAHPTRRDRAGEHPEARLHRPVARPALLPDGLEAATCGGFREAHAPGPDGLEALSVALRRVAPQVSDAVHGAGERHCTEGDRARTAEDLRACSRALALEEAGRVERRVCGG